MGFIKLPNDLTEWAWFDDNNTLAVYVRLVLGANWKDREYKNVHLKRGQIVTTIPQIAEQSGLTIQQVRTVIDRLKSTGKITVERTSKFSIITLIEYECDAVSNSQDNRQITDEQQTNNSQTTDEQQSSNRPTTDEQQSPYINRKTEDQKDRKTEDKIDRKTEREDESALASPNESKPKKSKKTSPPKKTYAEYVTLTEEEYSKLIEQYGEEATQWCIRKLDNYKGSTGKKYASDYRTILSWVIGSYQEEQAKHKQPVAQSRPPESFSTGNPFLDMLRDLEEQEAKEIVAQGNTTDNGDT